MLTTTLYSKCEINKHKNDGADCHLDMRPYVHAIA